jgi:hypothetical protein
VISRTGDTLEAKDRKRGLQSENMSIESGPQARATNPFSPPRPPRLRAEGRPGCLTAVCAFLFFAALVWLFLALIYEGDRGGWYPAHYVLQAVGIGVAAVGIWRMRKWGVVLFAAVAALIHILYVFTGLINLETFVIYAATLGPAVYFYPRME